MCDKPGQQISDGFCYDSCPNTWKPYGAMCLKNCPENQFTDHGQSCMPNTILRSPINSFVKPCAPGQIDQNGNCFEPFSYSWYNKVTGCGCIRTYYKDRVQCPAGFQLFNTMCLPNCPPGYADIRNPITGQITSMYCTIECPYKTNSKTERWPFLGGQCVKEAKSRLVHSMNTSVTSSSAPMRRPLFGSPKTILSLIAKKQYGSNQSERNRVGFNIQQSLVQNESAKSLGSVVGSTDQTSSDLIALAIFIGVAGFVYYGGSTFFPLLATGLGDLVKGIGFVGEGVGFAVEGAGKATELVEEGAGQLIKSTAGVVGASENFAASGINRAS